MKWNVENDFASAVLFDGFETPIAISFPAVAVAAVVVIFSWIPAVFSFADSSLVHVGNSSAVLLSKAETEDHDETVEDEDDSVVKARENESGGRS